MIIDDSWYVKPEGTPNRHVAGGIVVRFENKTPLIALVREGNKNLYILPKGGIEAGESAEEAARREIQEESGITSLHLINEAGKKERLEFNKKTWSIAQYFLFLTEKKEGTPTDTSKPYRLEWFALDQLPAMLWKEQRELIEENTDKIMSLRGT